MVDHQIETLTKQVRDKVHICFEGFLCVSNNGKEKKFSVCISLHCDRITFYPFTVESHCNSVASGLHRTGIKELHKLILRDWLLTEITSIRLDSRAKNNIL